MQLGPTPGRTAKYPTAFPIGKQRRNRFCKETRVMFDQDVLFPRATELVRQAQERGQNTGHTTAEGLADYVGHALFPRREHEQVGSPQVFLDIAYRAREDHAIGTLAVAERRSKPLTERGVSLHASSLFRADQYQMSARPLRGNTIPSFREVVQTFPLVYGPNKEYQLTRGIEAQPLPGPSKTRWHCTRPEPLQVNPVRYCFDSGRDTTPPQVVTHDAATHHDTIDKPVAQGPV
jgi:hypothetical protein